MMSTGFLHIITKNKYKENFFCTSRHLYCHEIGTIYVQLYVASGVECLVIVMAILNAISLNINLKKKIKRYQVLQVFDALQWVLDAE